MANSIITRVGDGVTTQFSLNFTLGILRRSYIKCRVGDESDGTGEPIYRTLEWITDGLVNIQGDVPGVGVPIVFTRTIPKDTLIHDYSDGVPITERNLDESNLQHIMAIHEFLDGRLEQGFVQDLNMNGYKILNLADGTADTDAANMRQLNIILSNPGYITVRDDLLGPNNIGTVANSISNVNIVAPDIASVNAVAGSIANVNTVSGSIANVDTVSSNIGSVSTVSGAISNVNTVAGDITDVNTVSSNIGSVILTAANETSINTVAVNMSDVTSAASNMGAIIAAPGAASAAAASEARAYQWANNPEDVEVIGGEFSAYHWAKKAEDALSREAEDITYDPTGNTVITGTNVQDALDDVEPVLAGLGSAAEEDVGTAIGNVVQLENVGGNPGLPAVDGRQLTGIDKTLAVGIVNVGSSTFRANSGFASVVRTASGVYTFTMATAAPDTNYVILAMGSRYNGASTGTVIAESHSTEFTRTTTRFQLRLSGTSATTDMGESIYVEVRRI